MSNPHPPGTPEWQAWLNEQIAAHDAQEAVKKRNAEIDAENKRKVQEAIAEAAKQAAQRDKEKGK